jgi:hypothetical protein
LVVLAEAVVLVIATLRLALDFLQLLTQALVAVLVTLELVLEEIIILAAQAALAS